NVADHLPPATRLHWHASSVTGGSPLPRLCLCLPEDHPLLAGDGSQSYGWSLSLERLLQEWANGQLQAVILVDGLRYMSATVWIFPPLLDQPASSIAVPHSIC